ncbi:MAG: hypothetical protein F4066_04440, partial [Chloroflexi bacterium]|nr:hypothetical protein [Chloroflexota bacterium]
MATQPVPASEIPEPPEMAEFDVVEGEFGDQPPDDPEGRELTLGEHLNEIRQRLTVTVLTLVLTTVITLVFASTILDYLLEPGRDALPEFRPIYTELLGFIGA